MKQAHQEPQRALYPKISQKISDIFTPLKWPWVQWGCVYLSCTVTGAAGNKAADQPVCVRDKYWYTPPQIDVYVLNDTLYTAEKLWALRLQCFESPKS